MKPSCASGLWSEVKEEEGQKIRGRETEADSTRDITGLVSED